MYNQSPPPTPPTPPAPPSPPSPPEPPAPPAPPFPPQQPVQPPVQPVQPALPVQPSAPAASPGQAQATPQQGKKIIIIEDEMMLQTALADMLTAEGYQVFKAGDGAQGLNLINSIKPDMILLDINMPVMDGITMLKKVRENPQFNTLKIIMLTNYNDASKMSDVLNMNVDKYIVKAEIQLEEISQLVHFLLFGPL